jgi:hypothetical protein
MAVLLALFYCILPVLADPDCSGLPTTLRLFADGKCDPGTNICDYLKNHQEEACCLWLNRHNLPAPAGEPASPSVPPTIPAEKIGPVPLPAICGSSTAHLSCTGAPGVKIWVESAHFGRTDASTCSNGIGSPGGAELANTNCDADVTAQVRVLCNGQSECDVPSSTDAYGDPCAGISKYTTVVYYCVPDYRFTELALGDQPAPPPVVTNCDPMSGQDALAKCDAQNVFNACSDHLGGETHEHETLKTSEEQAAESKPPAEEPKPPAEQPKPPAEEEPKPPAGGSHPATPAGGQESGGQQHPAAGATTANNPVVQNEKKGPHKKTKKYILKVVLTFKGKSNDPNFGSEVAAAVADLLGVTHDRAVATGVHEGSFLETNMQLEETNGGAMMGMTNSQPTTTVNVAVISDFDIDAKALADKFAKLSADQVQTSLPAEDMSASAPTTATVETCSDGRTVVDASCQKSSAVTANPSVTILVTVFALIGAFLFV